MKTIDIITAQNVTIEYELARFQDRLFAFLIDAIVIIVIGVVIITMLVMTLNHFKIDALGYAKFLGLLPMLLFLGYQLGTEVFMKGQTLGKKIMGLKVVRIDGAVPNLSDYILRQVFHIVDTLFSLGVIATIMINSSVRSQRIGDMAANTIVIRTESGSKVSLKDLTNIESLENYEPVYPKIKTMTDEDMLLVKQVIQRYQKNQTPTNLKAVNALAQKLTSILDLKETPNDRIAFFKTLIKDYIVLTR